MTRRAPSIVWRAWWFATLALLVRAAADGVLAARCEPAWRCAPVRLDVNRATVAELTALPGFGRARAEALVVERIRRGPFRGLADLERVDGIGPTNAAAVAAWLDFGSPPPGR
ncbi:MAG: ComEA family DNA-binding protein [Planctomycetota bacterium]